MNSSTECLVSSTPPEKIRYAGKHLVVQSKVRNNGMGRKAKQPDSAQYACIMFVGLLLIGMVLALAGIFSFYISHLQQHVTRLEERIQALESRSCYQEWADALDQEEADEMAIEDRFRRDTEDDDDEAEGSRHHRAEHHGIASHNIAMVYGDPQKVRTVPDEHEANERKFTAITDSDDAEQCGTLYERGDDQKWCTVITRNGTRREIPKYRTSRYDHMYYYFAKAAWMNRTKSIENFNLTYDGRIEVKHEGIYIVHASIHFVDLTSRDHPNYGVYKTDSLGNGRKLISKCVITPGERLETSNGGVYPCQAWQMIHLKAGEQVFMSIGGYSWFRIEKETFHLALIKLNDYSL